MPKTPIERWIIDGSRALYDHLGIVAVQQRRRYDIETNGDELDRGDVASEAEVRAIYDKFRA